MFATNNKISARQLQILLILDIFGIGITILPGKMTQLSLQDGWFAILLGTVGLCICTYIITKLCAAFPNDDFVGFSRKLLSYPIGTLLSFGFVIKLIVTAALELRLFSEIIKQIMLFETPLWTVSLCMLLLGSYAASKGFEARGRIGEILIFIIFIPLVFVFAIAVTDVDPTNLKPFLYTKGTSLLKAAFLCTLSLWASEFVLLSYPYLNTDKRSVGKKIILSVSIAGIILSIITAITTARFGIYDMPRQMWPVLEIMDTIDLPGSFIERQDALIMSFWIISIFVIINAGMFFSSLLLKNTVEKGTHTFYIILSAIAVYFISFAPQNISQLYDCINRLNVYFGWIYLFAVPLLLLIISKIRKLGGGEDE